MKKSNFIVLGISAIAAALLLALWYYLGFNHIDNPLDLVLAIVWWIGIVVIAVVIARLERQRQRQIRTIYVSPTALYNSESGVVGLKGATAVEGMQSILRNLKYGFDKKAMPDQAKFDYRFVVQTDEFKPADEEKQEEGTWKGTVIRIDRENGNEEIGFDNEQALKEALVAA